METPNKLLIASTLLLIFVATGCSMFKGWSYPQDNIVEESVEVVIEGQTGFDIDLSPGSPEIDALPHN